MSVVNYYLLILLGCISFDSACQIDDHYHAMLWTSYLQGHHDHTKARDCYEIIFVHNPSIHIYPMFVEHLFNTSRFQGITELTHHIEHQVSFNKQQALMIVESFLNIGNTQEALKRLEVVATECYQSVELILRVAHLYAGLKNYAQALYHLNMFLNNSSSHSHHYIIHFTKAHMHVQLSNYDAAKKHAMKSLKLNPNLQQAWLLLAFIYNKENNSTQAHQCYQKYSALLSSKH